MTAPALAAVLQRARASCGTCEGSGGGSWTLSPAAAGAAVWPAGREVLELSPAQVSEQRRDRVGVGSRLMPSIWRRSPSCCWLVMGLLSRSTGAVIELTGLALHRGRRCRPGLR